MTIVSVLVFGPRSAVQSFVVCIKLPFPPPPTTVAPSPLPPVQVVSFGDFDFTLVTPPGVNGGTITRAGLNDIFPAVGHDPTTPVPSIPAAMTGSAATTVTR